MISNKKEISNTDTRTNANFRTEQDNFQNVMPINNSFTHIEVVPERMNELHSISTIDSVKVIHDIERSHDFIDADTVRQFLHNIFDVVDDQLKMITNCKYKF